MGVDMTSLGAWMEHGSLVLNGARGAGEEPDFGEDGPARVGVHGLVRCPAGEEVDAGCLQLARARSEQCKVEMPILDVTAHFVEEVGKTLDFVDHHPAPRRGGLEIRGEERWIGEVVLVAGLVEQIDAQRIGKLCSRPGALADPADAEEEEALPGLLRQTGYGVAALPPVFFEEI